MEVLRSTTERAQVLNDRYHMHQQSAPEMEMVLNQRKVPVVYYLCRNRQMEHPHFIEVPLVSPHGLYLRDVIEKFDSLRGRGMASMYSWSCKRSYKNAYVWNDLCEDDLVVPANGNEYVLKGSELVEETISGRSAPAKIIKSQNLEQLTEPSLITQDDCLSPVTQDVCNSKTNYRIHKNAHGLTDASTQTEERVKVKKARETRTTSRLIDNVAVESLTNNSPPSSFSARSSAGKTETLESLMKADVSNLNTSEKLEEKEEECQVPPNPKLRTSKMLLHLLSCGSISPQDHDFSRTLSCRSRSLDSKISSCEVNCLLENPMFMGMKLEDKQYFSGSLFETKLSKEESFSSLKRSSSYTTNRINKCDSTLNRTKCIPRSIMGSLTKHPRSASMRFSDAPNSCLQSSCISNKRIESLRDNKENVIKIEESLLQELGSSSTWKQMIAVILARSGSFRNQLTCSFGNFFGKLAKVSQNIKETEVA